MPIAMPMLFSSLDQRKLIMGANDKGIFKGLVEGVENEVKAGLTHCGQAAERLGAEASAILESPVGKDVADALMFVGGPRAKEEETLLVEAETIYRDRSIVSEAASATSGAAREINREELLRHGLFGRALVRYHDIEPLIPPEHKGIALTSMLGDIFDTPRLKGESGYARMQRIFGS
jgi:hypothetical protein